MFHLPVYVNILLAMPFLALYNVADNFLPTMLPTGEVAMLSNIAVLAASLEYIGSKAIAGQDLQ